MVSGERPARGRRGEGLGAPPGSAAMAGIFNPTTQSGDASEASGAPAANCTAAAAAAGVAAAVGETQAPLKGTAHGESTDTTGRAAGAAGAKGPWSSHLFNESPPLIDPPLVEPPRKRPPVRDADGGRPFSRPAGRRRPLTANAAAVSGGCSGKFSSSPAAQEEDAALTLSKLVPRDSRLLELLREPPDDNLEPVVAVVATEAEESTLRRPVESRGCWSDNTDEQRSITIGSNSFQLCARGAVCGGPACPVAKVLRDRLLGL